MLAEITPEELAAALDRLAEELLAAAGIEVPPVDAFRLAAALGLTVAEDCGQSGRARFVRLARGPRNPVPTVFLRPDPRPERLHWALAHEVSEHAIWRLFEALKIDPREAPPAAREQAANRLAGRLLLPTAWLAADAAAGEWDLLRLKARYATASHELIARRMLDFPPSVVVTIFDQRQVTFRGASGGRRPPPLAPGENTCWREVHRRNRPAQRRAEGYRVRGWPVHEPSWKREILRTEVDDP